MKANTLGVGSCLVVWVAPCAGWALASRWPSLAIVLYVHEGGGVRVASLATQ